MPEPDRGWIRRLAIGLGAGGLVALMILLGARLLFRSNEPAAAMEAPRFVEEAVAAGIEHVYDGDFIFFVGGGVAVFDCDEDGRPDLFLAGGANPASLYRNESEVGGALSFVELPDPATDLTGVTGAYPLDIDSDGHLDLSMQRVGENVLLRGLGGCRFERANETWSFDGGEAWTVGFSATWEDGAAFPSLAFGNYLTLDDAGAPVYACEDNLLLRPTEDGRYPAATTLAPGWCTLSMLFSDWDRSGRADLRMANDRHYYRDGSEQLWRIVPGEAPHLFTEEEGWRLLQIWGMGIASQDLTGDGRPEVVITSQGDNKLQTLDADASGPSYYDIAIKRGTTAHRPFTGDTVLPSTAWHPEFQDVNNDGFVDLFISKGNVDATVEYAAEDPSNLLLGQADGSFVEAAESAGILSLGRGRGAALADFNLDGMLDLVEVNRRENVKVWRNVGWGEPAAPAPMGNWIAVRPAQAGSNPDAVGSWVEVKVGDRIVQRELTVGGGHAGGQIGWIHFGLGESGSAEVRIQWPDGEAGPWQSVGANTFVIVDRDAQEVQIWSPAEALSGG